MKRLTLTVLIVFCQAATIFSQTRADDVIGYYLAYDPGNGDKAQMEVYKTAEGKYEVRVVWVENQSNSRQIGRVQIRNLTYDTRSNSWKDGKVMYGGREYSMTVSFANDGRLRVRGYLGISMLGRTQYWTKERELRR